MHVGLGAIAGAVLSVAAVVALLGSDDGAAGRPPVYVTGASPRDAVTTLPAPSAPAPSVAASSPTTTVAVASEVPVPTPPATASVDGPGVTEFRGFGNFVIDLTGHDVADTIMVVTHAGNGAFELSILDHGLSQLDVVESADGAVAGTYPLGLDGSDPPSYLRVDAEGGWLIEIRPIGEARVWNADFISGSGSDVLRFEGGASVFGYTNSGSSNFIVQYFREARFDLLVNELGPVSGTTTIQSGPGVVVVRAEGEWALSARPA